MGWVLCCLAGTEVSLSGRGWQQPSALTVSSIAVTHGTERYIFHGRQWNSRFGQMTTNLSAVQLFLPEGLLARIMLMQSFHRGGTREPSIAISCHSEPVLTVKKTKQNKTWT